MTETTYQTLTGRRFDLSGLSAIERTFIAEIIAYYEARPRWEDFVREWPRRIEKALGAAISMDHPARRICQDLAARLGVAEGRVAPPDYRDRLADLIDERFGSRYAFCKATGIDQGHLSRVLAGQKHLAADTLQRALDALGVDIEIVPRPSPLPLVVDGAVEDLRRVEHRVSLLRNLLAQAENTPAEAWPELLGEPGLFPDDADELRRRVQAGESLRAILASTLADALREKGKIALRIGTESADEAKASRRQKVG